MAFTMFYHMGWVGFSAVADEATHCYPHVCEVPLDILYPRGDKGDRAGLSAVTGDVDLRGSGWIGVVSVVSSSYAIGLQMG